MKTISTHRLSLIAIVLVVVIAIGTRVPSASSQLPSGPVIWSANFETGDNSQFTTTNGGPNVGGGNVNAQCNDGVIGVSSLNPPTNGGIVHSGNYAGYYYGVLPSGMSDCHESPVVWFKSSYPDFLFDGWFYVPSSQPMCNSQSQSGSCWVSFATFGNQPDDAIILAIDSLANREAYLWSVGLGYGFYQTGMGSRGGTGNVVQWPYDKWFELTVVSYNMGSSDASFVMYEDGTPIVSASGNLMPAPLYAFHAGAYLGAGQPSWAVYNDDFVIEDLSGASTSTSDTSVRSTSTTLPVTSTTSTTAVQSTTSWSTTTYGQAQHHHHHYQRFQLQPSFLFPTSYGSTYVVCMSSRCLVVSG